MVTKPPRFEKSLNLSLILEFLELNDVLDKIKYLEDIEIWKTEFKKKLFKYSVIHLNLSRCYCDNETLLSNF